MLEAVTVDIPYTVDTGEKLVNETLRAEQYSPAQDGNP